MDIRSTLQDAVSTLNKHTVFSALYKNAVKPLLFKLDPEDAHDYIIKAGDVISKAAPLREMAGLAFNYQNPFLEQKVNGLNFLNPVGLSAGLDKDGYLADVLPKVGFGFHQVGSVTLRPYEGNPGKRAVRLVNSKGIVVNYGLKNEGIEVISQRLSAQGQAPVPVSISIARTNSVDTGPLDAGIADYVACISRCEQLDIGDLYTINISCPNTADGEPFGDADALEQLLVEVSKLNVEKPIYLKMPIDRSWEDFSEMLKVAIKYGIDGVVIGNLLKDRESDTLKDPIDPDQPGGVSGLPTREVNNELIFNTYKYYGGDLTIIGVGGIFSAEDAYMKIRLGASLVQLITGLIFNGPQLVGEINRGLVELAQADGYTNISQARGTYHARHSTYVG